MSEQAGEWHKTWNEERPDVAYLNITAAKGWPHEETTSWLMPMQIVDRIIADHQQAQRVPGLERVLEHWMTRSEFLSGRWPCPFCGKEDAEPLRAIELANGNLVGCWLCNTEDLRDETFAALKSAGGNL